MHYQVCIIQYAIVFLTLPWYLINQLVGEA